MLTDKVITTILTTLQDPFLHLTAQEMHLQYHVESTSQSLHLHLTAGFPCQLLENTFKPLLLNTLEKEFPHLQCSVTFETAIVAHKTQLAGKGLRGVKNTIAVASGKGGVGKSTVAVNLAAALARAGARVGILDADIYGPSIPLMLGSGTPVEMHEEHYLPVKAHGLQAMSIGYLTDNNQALLWRGPMLAKSLIQLLDITKWDNLDYLFIDLPPGTGDIQLSLVQKIPLTAALVVTTPQNVATLDAHKALQLFSTTGIDVLGLIENMSTHICSHCGHQEAIFGEGGAQTLSHTHQSPLLGQLPLDSRIRQHCDQGEPTATQPRDSLVDTFLQTALYSAIALSDKALNYADKLSQIPVVTA